LDDFGGSECDEWTIWFLTSNASRKAADIRHDGRVTVGYQHDPDSAYVALVGDATIVEVADIASLEPKSELNLA
jgi:general stress protein 26